MKKFFVPAMAFVLAAGASAFTVPSEKGEKPDALKYWRYTLYGQPGQDDAVNLNNPDNYELTSNDGQDPLVCSGAAHRCGIQAEESGGEPVMSGATIFQRN